MNHLFENNDFDDFREFENMIGEMEIKMSPALLEKLRNLANAKIALLLEINNALLSNNIIKRRTSEERVNT